MVCVQRRRSDSNSDDNGDNEVYHNTGDESEGANTSSESSAAGSGTGINSDEIDDHDAAAVLYEQHLEEAQRRQQAHEKAAEQHKREIEELQDKVTLLQSDKTKLFKLLKQQ